MRRILGGLFATVMCALTAPGIAQAHKPSDSYLTVRAEDRSLDIRWDISLKDLEYAVGIDADGDRLITWGEIQAALPGVLAYAGNSLTAQTGDIGCPIEWSSRALDSHTDGVYLVLNGTATCAQPAHGSVRLSYNLLFDIDTQHRGLLRFDTGETQSFAIFRPEERTFTSGAADMTIGSSFLHFLVEGVWHIWIGYDHILFLLALLLPSVLARSGKNVEGVASLGLALKNVLKVVTAFTIAHSITLALASFELVELPSRLVESVIALSVVIAALNNLHAIFDERRAWLFAFAFGLIHGFGFASVLGELGASGSALVTTLLGFNAGVELGQLAIIAAFLPVAFILRNSYAYRRVMLTGGSYAIVFLAAIWFTERAFDVVFLG